MTFPYIVSAMFEDGTLAPFDSVTDTESKITFPHYTQLARQAVPELPYRGAYCGQIDLALGTADAMFVEATGFAVSANTAAALRLYLWVGTDLVMANNDTFDLLRWNSTGPVAEFSVNLLHTGGLVQIRAGDSGGATFRSAPLTLGVWHCVEMVINTGTGANGTATFLLDDAQVGASVGSIASAALDGGQLGAMGIDAGTTAGTLRFDAVVVDDTRVGPLARFPQLITLESSGHVVVGPGVLEEYALLDNGSNDTTLTLYDTDQADTAQPPFALALADTSSNRFDEPMLSMGQFQRGCYAVLTGTSPRAFFHLRHGPRSRANVLQAAYRR